MDFTHKKTLAIFFFMLHNISFAVMQEKPLAYDVYQQYDYKEQEDNQ